MFTNLEMLYGEVQQLERTLCDLSPRERCHIERVVGQLLAFAAMKDREAAMLRREAAERRFERVERFYLRSPQ